MDLAIRAGYETAEWDYEAVARGAATPRHSLPERHRVRHGDVRGFDSAFVRTLSAPMRIAAVELLAVFELRSEEPPPKSPWPIGPRQSTPYPDIHVLGIALRGADGESLQVPLQADGGIRVAVPGSANLNAPGGLKVFRADDVGERAYVVREVFVASNPGDAIRILASEEFDFERQSVLQAQTSESGHVATSFLEWIGLVPPHDGTGVLDDSSLKGLRHIAVSVEDRHFLIGSAQPGGDVRIIEDLPERVVLASSLQEPGLVILADSMYPGWRVRIDGREAPILRVNHNFRGVLAGPGLHRIQFDYDPADFRTGWITSAVVATAAAVGLLAAPLRRRRASQDGVIE